MSFKSILIANRGEIAIRIARAAADLGIKTVAVHSDDDAASLHTRIADEARPLGASGPAAYLDIPRVIAAAKDSGCEAIHPGYGFLSENAEFARACAAAGIVFIGPSPEVLSVFGDKARARALADRYGVPVLEGTSGATTLDEARAFMDKRKGGAIMIKALAGGGGRGMRMVTTPDQLDEAYARASSEAKASFGNDAVYVEAYMPHARHIEVQVAGDGKTASHIWERDCSLQRRHQKIVEIAPAPALDPDLRQQLCDAAVWLADDVKLTGLATVEFLVDPKPQRHMPAFAFIECNPRLQVEHTVTEEITGIDLVAVQIELARGNSLRDIGLKQENIPKPRGVALQLRVNMEKLGPDGSLRPTGGTLARFVPPSGPGVRVDTYGYEGYTTNPAFDPLLAKLVVQAPDFTLALGRAKRALGEFVIAGVETNIAFLDALLDNPEVAGRRTHTRVVEENLPALLAAAAAWKPHVHAVAAPAATATATASSPAGTVAVPAPMQGKIVSVDVAPGDMVAKGAAVAVLEAMKMEHLVAAGVSGRVHSLAAAPGTVLFEGDPLVFLTPEAVEASDAVETAADPNAIRPDLAEANARHAFGFDAHRPDAVARRRKTNQRTARENLADLVDPGSFIEYGALAFAAQKRRRTLDDLIRNTPGDGIVTGIGTVNAALFGEEAARTAVLAYDYTVLAGTQGAMNHRKKDRLLKVVEDAEIPVVLFAEGGGGRPGDTDFPGVAGLDTPTFRQYAKLSGKVPRIGINSGRCFAGNAALLGSSDIVIATAYSNIGMGGPAMIEGGGLGVYTPDEVGPMSVQVPNGVVDIAVADEADAVAAAKKYLSYFQGALKDWSAADQNNLRTLIPENRLRVYDIRKVIAALADTNTVQELRPEFAPGMITALVRIEGHAFGLIANNPMHLAGAIDAPCADKAARFLQLCDSFGLPIVSLCDTPGFMVGPEAEKASLVRKTSRMFVVSGGMTVPMFTVVLRKGYGLGAQAMAGGSFHAPFFIVSWPTGEFGGMGLEGAVRLGFRKELEAEPTPQAREALFKKKVEESYARGKAINMAAYLEIDDVIDPADTRRWILRGLKSAPPGKGSRRFVDTW
jgi:acetyl/propionyl-CoA carboxylase alpha subunit